MLGQRALLIYNANRDRFKGAGFSDGTIKKEQFYDIYTSRRPWTNPVQLTKINEVPSVDGFLFENWYRFMKDEYNFAKYPKQAIFNFNQDFFVNKENLIVQPLLDDENYHEIYAGYLRAFDVIHLFESTTEKPLPEALKERLKKAYNYKKKNGEYVKPNQLIDVSDFYVQDEGTWVFDGWYIGEEKATGKTLRLSYGQYPKDNIALCFVGKWHFEKEENYQVSYQFSKTSDTKLALPKAIETFLPSDNNKYKVGSEVIPKAPLHAVYKDDLNDGLWRFIGWDYASQKVVDSDVVFVGSWAFWENHHSVTHSFTADKEAKFPLPEAISSRLTEDKNYSKLANGKKVAPNQQIDTSDYLDVLNDGIWHFKGWDNNAITVDKKDACFLGSWSFSPNKYTVSYGFEALDKMSPLLPKGLLDRALKVKKQGIFSKIVVSPKGVDTSDYRDALNDGVWQFKGWDKDEVLLEKSDVSFVGKWQFLPNRYEVSYQFVSEDANRPLPKEVIAVLPKTEVNKVKGDKVRPSLPQTVEVAVSGGKWLFVAWDKSEVYIDKGDACFIGKWQFKASSSSYLFEEEEQEASTLIETKKETTKEKILKGYISGDLTKHFYPDKGLSRGEMAVMLEKCLDKTDKLNAYQAKFIDVSSTNWQAKAIEALSAQGFIKGYPDNTFRYDKLVTRREFIWLLIQAKMPEVKGEAKLFKDVKENDWAKEAIALATQAGIVSGYPDETFRPEATLTRAEAVRMINKALFSDEKIMLDKNPFVDLKPTHWAYQDILYAVSIRR